MRPTTTAVVVALVLLAAAFLMIVPTEGRVYGSPGHSASGLRAAVTPSYSVALDFVNAPVLAGSHDGLAYEVRNNTNGAPIETLSSITIRGIYYNTALMQMTLPGTPVNISTAPIGVWGFSVPANASTAGGYGPFITVWANSTSLGMNQSDSIELTIGNLVISSSFICGVVNCASGALTVGNPSSVGVTVVAEDVYDDIAPVANATVAFSFYSTGSSPVSVPGVPASVSTNGLGDAEVTFTPTSTVFNVPGPDHVDVKVTDSVNANLNTTLTIPFNLYNPMGTANFAFTLNQAFYYSGEPVTATWQWAGTNVTIGTINVTNFYAIDDSTDNIIASGLIGSTSPTGTFTFSLPSNYAGAFTVYALVHNGSDSWVLETGADAETVLFGITPSEIYFSPGNTVTVTIIADGPALKGTTVSAFVQATNSGQTLFNSTVSGSTFQFIIPKVAPAPDYEIAAWAWSASNGTVASSEAEISEASGYNLWAGISSVSSYSDGSFAPGQTVDLSYKVTASGPVPLPTLVELYVYPGACTYFICNDPYEAPLSSWVLSGASGTVSFTIPSDTPNGVQTFNVLAAFPGPNGEGAAQVSVNINSSPSALNYELGAGSGLTVGWLILLILIIVVAIVLVWMLRRDRPSRMVVSRTTSTPEWKEPAPAGATGPTDTSSTSSSAATESGAPPETPPGAQ